MSGIKSKFDPYSAVVIDDHVKIIYLVYNEIISM